MKERKMKDPKKSKKIQTDSSRNSKENFFRKKFKPDKRARFKNKKKWMDQDVFNRSEEITPIDKTKLERYSRGDPTNKNLVKKGNERQKLTHKEKNVNFALEQSVRTELLLTEEAGYIEAGDGEATSQISQSKIQDVVDPNNAAKRFDLVLSDFGPYRMNYTRNGRFLLLGGRKGHVAALDWISKKLMCEINVMESVHDVAWLHQETLYCIAQKKWVYFYDNQGIEIHCVKQLYDVIRTIFLPYHFLLSTVSSSGRITWLDVTMGKIVEQFHIPVHHNAATVAMHPGNALICIGRPSGIINFWSPNHHKPCITKWCHRQPLTALAFDPKGEVLVTASVDRTVKLWDARNLDGPMQHYTLRSAPNWITLSQTGLMALGMGNIVEIYNDCRVEGEMGKKLYLRHEVKSPVQNMEFCPYEDILGIGHSTGYSSILVPGSGEPNFDALESNPFQTKIQRREREVQQLLTKIPPDLITWDPNEIRKVHVPSLEEIIEEKNKIGYVKPADIHIEPKYKTGKRAKATTVVKRKQIMKEQIRRNQVKMAKELKNDEIEQEKNEAAKKKKKKKKKKEASVLLRFKPKIKK